MPYVRAHTNPKMTTNGDGAAPTAVSKSSYPVHAYCQVYVDIIHNDLTILTNCVIRACIAYHHLLLSASSFRHNMVANKFFFITVVLTLA